MSSPAGNRGLFLSLLVEREELAAKNRTCALGAGSLTCSLLEGSLESEVTSINLEQMKLPVVLEVNSEVLSTTLSPL